MTRLQPHPGYESLAAVLDDALAQAQSGKGAERHASGLEPFDDQKIVQINEWLGSIHGQVFQVAKKAMEAARMTPDAARRELLGAINYAAAAVIQIDRAAYAEASARAEVPFGPVGKKRKKRGTR